MLMPKKYKYRKIQRGVLKGKSKDGNTLSFGEIGLRAISTAFITARQIEAVRVTIMRELKREGRLWIRIFPHKPYTKRPPETRMGKGKGDVEYYVAVVQPGRVMFEIAGVPEAAARSALKKAGYKLPCKTAILSKRGID
jgi:large subunit ribosomal protein L16